MFAYLQNLKKYPVHKPVYNLKQILIFDWLLFLNHVSMANENLPFTDWYRFCDFSFFSLPKLKESDLNEFKSESFKDIGPRNFNKCKFYYK